MTLAYLQLARLSATPLSRHIDTPEQAQPVYTCMDTLLADMMEDAKACNSRRAGAGIRTEATEAVPEGLILSIIASRPGITAIDIAKAVGRKPCNVRTRLYNMEARGQLMSEEFISPKTHRKTLRFYVVKDAPRTQNGRPPRMRPRQKRPMIREQVVAFIRANPGCTTLDVAAHLGCSRVAAINRIRDAHNSATGPDIRTVRVHGKDKPARHWIEGDAQ